ncbi:class I SAM-dependent methyltransferase [Paenibacillus tarimensis]|uniref:class I SAM-dependent methyltransferase n=1 Tax=Paenibacillus tarimensis TaxID=416012 RepID=UPI001F286258|nr:class I SAM-dependent methyltransferase [Paenibacillus tarimensis]MCF2945183.1 class I SAM-dependent methyltransferase [Paenibacillus tarimensis]
MVEAWKDFFQEDYLFFSEVILHSARTEREVRQLSEWLALHEGSEILDLGCGQGRIAIPLAVNGYNVTALDGSPAMLEAVVQRAEREGVKLRLVQSDMRDLDEHGRYDAVINLGTAFGYVPHVEDDEAIIGNVYKALKPGGQFVIDTENRDYKLKGQLGRSWFEMKGVKVLSERSYDVVSGRWHEILTWSQGEKGVSRVLDLHLYAPSEVVQMLKRAGFEIKGVYGGYDQSPIGLDSERLIVHCLKPGGTGSAS